ncbi:hypothetical protein CYMTET_15179 [Cymbomonas tetramitiformis]|uniref:Uncharacterized protein n=1 Tax=Cymbomonas tetramitiformis TaxID=36881 RepID=A0AAE0GET7_9CHLO|nr:hypothetical protein CYMTET_42141 [Cymbomonas tetramitiformis]KAK3276776.1 hypothetical protein CYMTET_15179 [Cymbomonas tetramitiformis]
MRALHSTDIETSSPDEDEQSYANHRSRWDAKKLHLGCYSGPLVDLIYFLLACIRNFRLKPHFGIAPDLRRGPELIRHLEASGAIQVIMVQTTVSAGRLVALPGVVPYRCTFRSPRAFAKLARRNFPLAAKLSRKARSHCAVPRRCLDSGNTRKVATRAASEFVQVAVDAWSVTDGTVLGARFAGVESQLFQFSLAPYLAYLWFLGREETGTPPASKAGATFLLLFVAATIPAGIASKKVYGDILANVDLLHGASESLLTVSNFLFALGFAYALSSPEPLREGLSPSTPPRAFPVRTLGLLVGVAGAATGATALAVSALGGPGALLGGVLHVEPANALSLPTWAVHVSSVAEWSLAMRLAWDYGDTSGNQAWKGVTWGMVPSLGSAFAACTFHLFYNAPSINALVPLQALLTLSGNCTLAFAAWRVNREGARLEARRAAEEEASALSLAPAAAAATTENDESHGTFDETAFAVKVGLGAAAGAVVVKYGELLLGETLFMPSYPAALASLILPTTAWTVYVTTRSREGEKGFWESLSMERVKEFGVAGTLSYVITELIFWAVAFPLAVAWYRVAEGSWLDLSETGDKAKLLGAGAVFINGVRALVPLRLAAALALAPTVQRALGAAGVEQEGDDDGEGSGKGDSVKDTPQ